MAEEEFRGFVDDEIITTSAARRKKLAILDQKVNHGEGPSYSEESTTSPNRHIVRRPPNRFLSRSRVPSGCSDSPKLSRELSSDLDTTEPISIQNSSQDVRKNITSASTSRKESDIEFETVDPVPSCNSVKTAILKTQISSTTGVPNSDIAIAGTSRRQNKFLKPVLKSTIEVSQVGATKAVQNANKVNEITEDHGRRQVNSKFSKPEEQVQQIAPIPTDDSGEEILSTESLASKQRKEILISGNATVAVVKPVPCLEDVSDKETPPVPKIDLNSCHDSFTNEDSKNEATSRTDDQEMPTLRQETKTEVPITKANNKPTPAKRTSSVSELSFLTAHTSRSKRTIVPNKRFFSTDSPPVLSKHDEEQVVKKNTMLPLQDMKKSGTMRNSSELTTTKKRSLSGDSVKRKRKSSGDIPLLKEKATAPPSENSSGPQSPLDRPRRTIIPNRKFFDDEPPKEPSPKKADVVEPKRKRRKSEKIAQIDAIPEIPAQQQVQLVVENKNGVTNALAIPIPDNTSNITGANDNVVESQTTETNLSPPMVNGTNNKEVNGSKTDLKIPEVEDEILLDESEVGLFRGKSIFVGTCIIRECEQIKEAKKEQKGFEGGIVYCGICERLKKYQILAEKRKRGSFLCVDCVVVVNKIFQNALKAKPFTCIIGPPICEGSCPLVFSPEDQFCQACFGKTCLKNLPMKDDIYFKIWRSIPPMSRGCVPTSPVVNTASPYVGKVLRVTANGEISSTSTSLKSLGLKKSNSNNLDASSEDSNTSDAMRNGDVDLNSARITTFAHRTDSSSNCENTVPFKRVDESLHSEKDIKTNGVAKEEILLDRQTGQERVKALIDPMLKPNFEDIEIFGFPVIISSQVYPRKPLCFLCGSAGIKQLIFCSMCCEPFHPYCAGDDLLMDTYISSCDTRDQVEETKHPTNSVDEQELGNLPTSDGHASPEIMIVKTQEVRDEISPLNAGRSHFSKMVVKWTCRRCLRCKSCQESIGHLELIRCKRCRNPFHLQSCIDKGLLSKIKDVDRLKKIWTCDTCLRCKSCGKEIEANRRLQTIQAAEKHEEEDDDESGDESRACNQGNFLMLCLECFRQRKKGSYCPICEVCYDDNDWDSKMMECVKCNRWIHSKCEKLTDDQYYILGTLPEYIEYSCRLCAPMENPVWYTAVQSQLTIRCNSALRDFEKTAVGDLRKKRSSIDQIKPSYVCNLFPGIGEESSIQLAPVFENSLKSAETEDDTHEGSYPLPKPTTDVGHTRLRESVRKETVSCKEIMSCKVHMRDFVKFPQTLEENWYAMKILGIEIVNQDKIPNMVEDKMPGTPIYSTPSKCYTPTKNLAIISDTIRQSMNTVQSVSDFKRLMTKAVKTRCESEREAGVMSAHFEQAVKNVFSWCQQDPVPTEGNDSNLSQELVLGEEEELENNASDSDDGSAQIVSTTDPFDEVYWDPIDFFDDRMCALCGEVGDFPAETCGRLLWAGVNEWIHCNCAIWSSEVWELENGALQQVGAALIRGRTLRCAVCNERGATVSCCNSGCKKSYHFLCARDANCNLLDDKTMICPRHKLTSEQEEDIQHDMKVGRKVFVDLDWIQKRGMKAVSTEIKVFIGSLRIDNLGSIVPISAEHLNWTNPPYTVLIPKDYRAQRVFWSVKDPWYKQCYTFEIAISSGGFGRKVQDVGVNLLVDHSKHERNVLKSIENITKFHQWLQQAPSYIDENFVDWLPPCLENFNEEPHDPNVFNTACNKAPSYPASPFVKSNYGSVSRKTPSEIAGEISDSIESMSTEGYSSSVDSTFNSTPTSSRGIRQKRRRSSCKTRKTSRKRSRLTPQKTLSPRRRSMRNIHMKECVPYSQDDKNTLMNNDSDNDSGVVESISSSGSNDGDRLRCRVNLLRQFNDSIDEQKPELKHDTQPDYGETVVYGDVSDSPAIAVPSSFEENLDVEETLHNETEVERNAMEIPKAFTATFKYEVKPKNTTSCFKSCNVKLAWMHLFDEVSKSRISHNLKPLVHPAYNMNVTDCDLEIANSYRMMGITHRTVQYLIEQLPDVLNVVDRHKFRYSHRPYVDVDNENVPVPINSTGCARTEGFQQRKPFDMFGWLASRHRKVVISCNISDESSRGQGLPLAMRFRDLQEKAKKRFVVLHSQIHGRGLYARCDVEKGDMIIEYAGEVIRHSLSDPRESYYESRGIGCYMFRIKTQVIDATLKGNAARFINHSCDPNCEAKTVRILGKDHIIIFAVRKIFKGEELTYDYKFEREEDKIPCTCGAPRCRKYLN